MLVSIVLITSVLTVVTLYNFSLSSPQGERLLLYISSEDIQDTFSFLVYLEELINNCSIAHLFTEEEKSHAINLIRGNVKQAGMEFSVEVAWKFFIRSVYDRDICMCAYVQYLRMRMSV